MNAFSKNPFLRMKNFCSIFFFVLLTLDGFSQKMEKLSVYFKFNEHVLDNKFKEKIDSLMRKNSVECVYLQGHCDFIGSNFYNDGLSTKRVLEVKQYLTSKNISESSIEIKALGKRVPLNNNENEKARALNRRVEIEFVYRKLIPVSKLATKPKDSLKVGASQPVKAAKTIKSVETPLKDTTILSVNEVQVGSTLVLKNLNFYPGKHVLLPQSNKTLASLYSTLMQNPTLEIEIQGHVCCEKRGDGIDLETKTRELSVNRAKAVYDYLLRRRILPSRISYKGFGSKHKLVVENSEEDMETNRRVEIMILKK